MVTPEVWWLVLFPVILGCLVADSFCGQHDPNTESQDSTVLQPVQRHDENIPTKTGCSGPNMFESHTSLRTGGPFEAHWRSCELSCEDFAIQKAGLAS